MSKSKAVKWCGRYIHLVRTEEFTLRDGTVWEREIWEYADGRPSVGRDEKDAIMFFKKVQPIAVSVVKHRVKSRPVRRLPKPKPVDIVAKIRDAIKPFGGGS